MSDPAIQVSQSLAGPVGVDQILYRLLAEDRINITFLLLDFLCRRRSISCCVEPEKLHHVRNYAGMDHGGVEYVNDVGLLSVYPHRFSLQSLGALVSFMGQKRHRFHSMASSTATVAFVVDADAQAGMAGDLAEFMGVAAPAADTAGRDYDHIATSLRKDPETVARYVEAKVKTYGIRSRSGVVVCRLDMAAADLAAWGERIGRLAACDLRFCFVSAVRSDGGRIRMNLVLDSDRRPGMTDRIAPVFSDGFADKVQILSEAAWVGFQGPHFGDRYGIANQAFSALHARSVPIWVGGCVGAAVSLVLPEKRLAEAEEALAEHFDTPESS